jgi:hypothetical protein
MRSVMNALPEAGESLGSVSMAVSAASMAASVALPWMVIRVLVCILTQMHIEAHACVYMLPCCGPWTAEMVAPD